MDKRHILIAMIGIAALMLSLGWGPESHAQIYQFLSRDGVLHFTNVPTDPRYRRMDKDRIPGTLTTALEIQKIVLSAARRNNLDPDLIKAVIKVESNFNSQAVSKAGAMGLMQLMPATAAMLRVKDPFNPRENVEGGVRHLRDLLHEFKGDLTLALAAYHAGATRVKQYGAVPPIEQTKEYIKKVLAAYQRYQK